VVGEISKPRQGRYHLAHGVSHGIRTLSPPQSPLSPPSPDWAGEGGGGKGGRSDPRLAPWAKIMSPTTWADFANELLTQDTSDRGALR
jgi:hypothetical protein